MNAVFPDDNEDAIFFFICPWIFLNQIQVQIILKEILWNLMTIRKIPNAIVSGSVMLLMMLMLNVERQRTRPKNVSVLLKSNVRNEELLVKVKHTEDIPYAFVESLYPFKTHILSQCSYF